MECRQKLNECILEKGPYGLNFELWIKINFWMPISAEWTGTKIVYIGLMVVKLWCYE